MVTRDDVEWFKSEEARRDFGVTSNEADAIDQLFRSAQLVGERVRRSFRGVVLGGGIGLQEADGMDDRRSSEELEVLRRQDEKTDWERICLDDVSRYGAGFWFMDPAALRFHTPAFILAALADKTDGEVPFKFYDASDTRDKLNGAINCEQRAAIRAFLLHALKDDFYESSHSEIREAAENYWVDGECSEEESGEPQGQ